jgi:gluconolactonase
MGEGSVVRVFRKKFELSPPHFLERDTEMRSLLHTRPIYFALLLVSSTAVAIGEKLRAESPIDGLGPIGEVVKLRGKYQFTEGPAYDGSRYLYFSDIPANRIMRLDTTVKDGEPEVFIEPSGMCNGLMIDGEGKLLGCRMESGQLVAFDVKSKQPTSLAAQNEGKRFNACNDLVIDKTGGVYFTDPRYRAPEPWPQGKEAVYYRAADGSVSRIADGFVAPNGIILSPDESKLYVIPSMESAVYVFDVTAPGTIANRREFFSMQQPEGQKDKGGDGLTMDVKGNLYITTGIGLQVVSPEGKLLGIIPVPEHPANATFGGPDMSTLYVTARTGLYSFPMSVQGHRFTGTVKP